ncbi:hypothetical protein D3C75_753240 [compost metagenome]
MSCRHAGLTFFLSTDVEFLYFIKIGFHLLSLPIQLYVDYINKNICRKTIYLVNICAENHIFRRYDEVVPNGLAKRGVKRKLECYLNYRIV